MAHQRHCTLRYYENDAKPKVLNALRRTGLKVILRMGKHGKRTRKMCRGPVTFRAANFSACVRRKWGGGGKRDKREIFAVRVNPRRGLTYVRAYATASAGTAECRKARARDEPDLPRVRPFRCGKFFGSAFPPESARRIRSANFLRRQRADNFNDAQRVKYSQIGNLIIFRDFILLTFK